MLEDFIVKFILRDVHKVPKGEMNEDSIGILEDWLKTTTYFSEIPAHDQLKSYLFLREGYLCKGCTIKAAKNIISQYDKDEPLYKGFEKMATRPHISNCSTCIK